MYPVRSAACPLLFFLNDPTTTEIYTLSLHDALPISLENPKTQQRVEVSVVRSPQMNQEGSLIPVEFLSPDRKSTRLNSSHRCISYAVFCLKKKKLAAVVTAHLQSEQLALRHSCNALV